MGQTRDEASRVPAACTLPAVDRPLRLAAFDEVFAESGRSVERPTETTVRIGFEPAPAAAARVADLAMREGSCCTFFGFTLRMSDGGLTLDIEVPASHSAVLTALAARAATAMAGVR
ncbi:hypothetical protein [Actinocatenispora thailandica]|nr:hypothetical protein [Actinocatenispora thailandica]